MTDDQRRQKTDRHLWHRTLRTSFHQGWEDFSVRRLACPTLKPFLGTSGFSTTPSFSSSWNSASTSGSDIRRTCSAYMHVNER